MRAMLLAAGLGTRLQPLTDIWPKCLMPVHGKPILEFWLATLKEQGISKVLVNTHHHAGTYNNFLKLDYFKCWVESVYEPILLGTAGTIRENYHFLQGDKILLAHADNWCHCNFSDFIDYHENHRPAGTLMTMMTFEAEHPESCGVVAINEQGVVINFYEKVKKPPSRLANAAVYILEPEIVDWIKQNEFSTDFSTEVIPHFINHIATWKNNDIHKDIGTINMLKKAQSDPVKLVPWDGNDDWHIKFSNNPIHNLIDDYD